MRNRFLVVTVLLTLAACGKSHLVPSVSKSVFELADAAFLSTANIASNFGILTTCDADGRPTSSNIGDADYAQEWTYCSLSTNSKSAGTIQGSYSLAATIMCLLEKKITFIYDETPVIHYYVYIAENDPCFGSGGLDYDRDGNTSGIFAMGVRESALSGVDYDFFIELQLDDGFFDAGNFRIWLKDSDNKLGAKIFNETDEAVTEIVIDKAAQTLMFESRDYAANRHVRAYVEGSLDINTGAFSSISSAQFIQGESSGRLVAFATNGTLTWYDNYSSLGGQVSPHYAVCSSGVLADCNAFAMNYSQNFHRFADYPSSGYDNEMILSLTFPLDMSF